MVLCVCIFLHKLYSVAENRRTWRTKPVINHHLLRGGCTSAAWRGSSCKFCTCAQNGRGPPGLNVPRSGGEGVSRQTRWDVLCRLNWPIGVCWDGLHPLSEGRLLMSALCPPRGICRVSSSYPLLTSPSFPDCKSR